jgi:hypothetical protein
LLDPRQACERALIAPRLGFGIGRAVQARDGLGPPPAQHEQRQRPVLERVLQPRDAGEHPRRVHFVRLLDEAVSALLEARHDPPRSNPTFSTVISASKRSLSPRSVSTPSKSWTPPERAADR